MLADIRDGAIGLLRGILEDVSRQSVLLTWGALLLAIYLTGWWRHEFERTGILVAVTLFLTSPRARGPMVGLALAALLGVFLHHTVTSDIAKVAAVINSEARSATGAPGTR